MRPKPLLLATALTIILGFSAAPVEAQVFVETGTFIGLGVQPGYVVEYGGGPWIAPGPILAPVVRHYPAVVPGSTVLVPPTTVIVPQPRRAYRRGRILIPRTHEVYAPGWGPPTFVRGWPAW